MVHQCLIVDLKQQGLQQELHELKSEYADKLKISFASSDDALAMLQTGTFVGLVLITEQADNNSISILENFKNNGGVIPHFQAIVCSEPSPIFMTQVFEYGLEYFISEKHFKTQAESFLSRIIELLDDPESTESKCIALARAVTDGDSALIKQRCEALGDLASYDFLAAHTSGVALQATGKYSEAITAFESAKKLNKMFRPAVSGVGENLLVLGKTDEALQIFESLEKLNKRSVDRKVNLAMVYIEKKDLTSAQRYLLEAEALEPGNDRIDELKTQLLLAQGKLKEAFGMMDKLHDVGPFFAAKLNEMGIKLSQAGKGKSALALYQKAHKIVKKELKYKISLNAALACYRMADYSRSLKYLQRSEQEHGETLEKAQKIKKAIVVQQRKKAASVKAG